MDQKELERALKEAKKMLFENPEVKEKWNDFTHVDNFADFLKSFGLIWWLGQRIVVAVEIVQKQYNLIKPEDRIEVASKLLDDLITFKGWASVLEMVDDKIFKIIITSIVHALNDYFGNKDWPTVLSF